MATSRNIVKSYQTAEYGKFLELSYSSSFPPVSVTRWTYPDNSSAFPENANSYPLSSVDIYPKYAILSHITNPEDISVSIDGGVSIDLSDLETLIQRTNTILSVLTGQTQRINGFIIPDYNRIKNYYINSTSNLDKVEYLNGSTVVATLSFIYAQPEVDGSALTEVIKIS